MIVKFNTTLEVMQQAFKSKEELEVLMDLSFSVSTRKLFSKQQKKFNQRGILKIILQISVLEHVRNTFTFQDTEDFTAEDLEDDFLNGQFYIQVNSDSYPGGIIRGQIEHKVTKFFSTNYYY